MASTYVGTIWVAWSHRSHSKRGHPIARPLCTNQRSRPYSYCGARKSIRRCRHALRRCSGCFAGLRPVQLCRPAPTAAWREPRRGRTAAVACAAGGGQHARLCTILTSDASAPCSVHRTCHRRRSLRPPPVGLARRCRCTRGESLCARPATAHRHTRCAEKRGSQQGAHGGV